MDGVPWEVRHTGGKISVWCVISDHLNGLEKFQTISFHSLKALEGEGEGVTSWQSAKCTEPEVQSSVPYSK